MDNRDVFGSGADSGKFGIGMAGGSHHEGDLMAQGGFDHAGGKGMDCKIDDALGLLHSCVEIFARVMGGGDDGSAVGVGGFGDGLAHPAGFSCDENW